MTPLLTDPSSDLNLENIEVFDPDPRNTVPANGDIERWDRDKVYSINTDINKYNLRLKTKGYPLHVYGAVETIVRTGEQQQRFIGGRGDLTARTKATQGRNIDMGTKEITLGSNAHLGPAEVDFSHADRTFGSSKDNPMFYEYDAAAGVRSAGIYPHHLYPQLKTSSNSLKIHTAQTGRIFGSATMTWNDNENESSGVEREDVMRYAEIFWLPMQKLAFTTNYRHQRMVEEAPFAEVLNPGSGAFGAPVDPDRKSTNDFVSAQVKFSPFTKLSMNATFSRNWKKYEDQTALVWHLPPENTTNTVDLHANWQLLSSLNLDGRLIQAKNEVSEPIHGVTADRLRYRANNAYIKTFFGTYKYFTPEHSTQGILSATWSPRDWVTLMLRGDMTWENSDKLKMINYYFEPIPQANDLDIRRDNLLASCTFMLSEKFNISPIYTFDNVRRKQDLAHANGLDSNQVDTGYSEDQRYHNFMLEAEYIPIKPLTLNASVDYTTGRGDYNPTESFWVRNFDLGLISQTRIHETTYRLKGNYGIGDGWSTGVDFQFVDWQDDSWDNPSEGTFFSTLLKVAKKF